MKSLLSVIVLLMFTGFFFRLDAQQIRENELVVIQGEKFVLHQVRTGETIYSITRQFNVSREVLIENNPDISSGLKIGDILKIPYREGANIQDTPVSQKGDPTRFITHTINSRKETPYFIAKEYDITVEQLYAYNPEVKRFRRGTKLRIPVWKISGQQLESLPQTGNEPLTQNNELIKHEVEPGETLYSISRKYKVSESEILFYNPGARDLKAGSIIYLPKNAEQLAAEKEEQQTEEELAVDIDMQPSFEPTVGNYFDHTIVSGETLWGITRKYDVSEQELKRINPVLESGFSAGVTIKIPVEENDLKRPKPVNKEAFIEHFVRRGETLYRLAREYDLSIPEIKKFNPVLESRNLVQGETILIPRKPNEEIVNFMEEIEPGEDSVKVEVPEFESDFYEIEMPVNVPEQCQPRENRFFDSKVYDVALFLPLFTLANDTLNRELVLPDSLFLEETFAEEELNGQEEITSEIDTTIEEELTKEMFHGFYGNSENFVQFYEGVLIAVDSMQKAGMNIRLNVYDTQQNPDSVRKFIYAEEFMETDLIIGPVYPDVQQEVGEISSKMRIPMVSPLAPQSAKLGSNPYLFQVNPSRDYLALKTAELVAEEYFNSNFIVFETGSSNSMAEKVVGLTKEKLYQSGYWGQSYGVDFNIYNFDEEGPFGFRRILSQTKENVVFVPSLNEGEVSVALSNINNLADDYSITLIGFNRYEQFSSIDLEFYFNLKLHYIDPYWVDYNDPATVEFIRNFKNNFYTEPTNFGIQGYDVAFYFLNAIFNYGENFEDCLPYNQAELIQGNYRFEKVSAFGGYMNEGVSVINYQRNYDVVRKRIIGQYRYAQKE